MAKKQKGRSPKSGERYSAKTTPPQVSDASPQRQLAPPAVERSESPEEKRLQSQVPVVGLCGSAGGLSAFKKFFVAMPPDSGLGFVVIPHLDPTHESLMVELLARHAKLPVVEAKEGACVEPNHAYVIPPNKYMTIRDGVLRLRGPVTRSGPSFDLFLQSLADDLQEKAIGIIFSGTGPHGILGLKAIKANGGLVIVQDPKSAEYDRMPQSAVNAGIADFILRPELIPAALIKYVQHWFVKNGGPGAAIEKGTDDLIALLEMLRAGAKCDFHPYRKKMLLRRIERRMGLNQIEHLGDYVKFAREHPEEVMLLAHDLLISVTSFFRDPEAFEALLSQAIRPLVNEKKNNETIRVWVPGCATGEEAYSVGMLFLEELSAAKKNCTLQLFATDVDQQSLEVARQAIYPESIVGGLTPQRLARFFTPADEHWYQINKPLREAVVCAVQNALMDAPFSKLDLISCRNFLIYLEPEVQKKVIALFHFALNKGGYLFLGPSETIGRQIDIFEPVNKKWRIYRQIGPRLLDRAQMPLFSPDVYRFDPNWSAPLRVGGRPVNISELVQQQLLETYAPTAVLINRKNEILYYWGRTSQYLNQPSGEPTQDLMALLREGLRAKLRSAVHRAVREQQTIVEHGGRVKHDGKYVAVSVTARPLHGPRLPDGLLLVVFEDDETIQVPQESPASESGEEAQTRALEYELKTTREDLQSSIEELESSNEELKAANEEVMSMNEELQSTNEELETSKEELQSLNEELTTVNNQLQEKVTELESANNDINNLFNCADVAILFLDSQLCIRRFTPAAKSLFKLIATDVGRPLDDIARQFADRDLQVEAQEVLHTLIPRGKEVTTADGGWFVRRILPYRTLDHHIDGVAITLADVTRTKQAEQEALENEERFRTAVEAAPNPMIMCDAHGTITMVNAQAEKQFGYAREEMIGQPVELLVPERFRERHAAERAEYMVSPELQLTGQRAELVCRNKSGKEFPALIGLSPLPRKGQTWVLRSIVDNTNRSLAQHAMNDLNVSLQARVDQGSRDLQASGEDIQAILGTAAEGIITIDENGIVTRFNKAAEQMFGYTLAEITGKNVNILMPMPYQDRHDSYLANYLATGVRKMIGVGREMRGRRKDSSTFPMHLSVSELNSGGRRLFTSIVHDISQRQALQREILETAANEQRRIGQDLHDSVGQELTGLGLLAEDLANSLGAAVGEAAKQRAQQIYMGLRQALQQIRELSRGLIPVEVDPEGLMTALRELTRKIVEKGLKNCSFQCDKQVLVDDPSTATHLFRIAQEAVTNAITHGRATQINIGLTTEGENGILTIQDNGLGIRAGTGKKTGIGLKIMQYRADMINAVLNVAAAVGGGTIVTCIFRSDPNHEAESNAGKKTQSPNSHR
jgi:two-component system, chemotaxis family, CheB/CheR fusion protein